MNLSEGDIDKCCVSCSNLPSDLLDSNNIKAHFKQFGRVIRICLKPKSKTCVIEYEDEASAEAAIMAAGEYNGFFFTVQQGKLFMRDPTSPLKKKSVFNTQLEKDPEWVPDPEVLSELQAHDQDTQPNEYNLRSLDEEKREKKLKKLVSRGLDPDEALAKLEKRQQKKILIKRNQTTRSPKPIVTSKFLNSNIKQLSNSKSVNLQKNLPRPKAWTQEQLDLLKLLKQPAQSIEEKYRVLDARDKLIRLRTKRSTDLSKAKKTIGTCPDMCPEKERLLRVVQHQVASYEQNPVTKALIPELAIKQYSRSSADQESSLAHDLRPVSVLQMTMAFLMHEVMDDCDRPDVNLADWYHFMWDRTRGIRKDITQQELCCQGSVTLVEQCARFHIHCSARLAGEDPSVFDQRINTENLTKCLQTLKYMYNDLRLKREQCLNEAEFRGYVILLNLNDGNFMWEVQQLPPEIQKSPQVKFAIQVYSALDKNNYVRFFKLVQSTTYLNACLLLRYFIQVRYKAVETLVKCYSPRLASGQYPIEELQKMLAFEGYQSTVDFFEYYNLSLNPEQTHIVLDKKSFFIPEVPYVVARAINVIEVKRVKSVGEIVSGGTLPLQNYKSHVPYSSFDSKGLIDYKIYFPDADDKIIVSEEAEDVKDIPTVSLSSESQKTLGNLSFKPATSARSKSPLFTPAGVSKDTVDKPTENILKSVWGTNSNSNSNTSQKSESQSSIGNKKSSSSAFGGFTFDLPPQPPTNINSSSKPASLFETFAQTNVEQNKPGSGSNSIFGFFGQQQQQKSIFGQPDQMQYQRQNIFGQFQNSGQIENSAQVEISGQTEGFGWNQNLSQVKYPCEMENMPQQNQSIFGKPLLEPGKFLQTDPKTTQQSFMFTLQEKPTDPSQMFQFNTTRNTPERSTFEEIRRIEEIKRIEETKRIEESKRNEEIKRIEETRRREEAERTKYIELERLQRELERKKKEELERLKKLQEEQQRVLKEQKLKLEQERIRREEERLKQEAEERRKMIEIKQTVFSLMDDLLYDVEEKCKNDRLTEITQNIQRFKSKLFIYKWREIIKNRKRKRKAIGTPLWASGIRAKEEAQELFMFSQEETLANIKRYKKGLPAKLTLLPESPVKKLDINNLIYPVLLNRITELDLGVFKEFYWKIVISLPDSNEMQFGLNRIQDTLNKMIHFDNDFRYLESFKTILGDKTSYCIEKLFGVNRIKPNVNGLLLVTKYVNSLFIDRLMELTRNSTRFFVVPVFIIIEDRDYNPAIFQELLNQHIISDCKIAVSSLSPPTFTEAFIEGFKYLASKYQKPPPLELENFKIFLVQHLGTELWTRIYSSSQFNKPYRECLTSPKIVVNLYNEALDRLKDIILDKDYLYYPDFPQEFESIAERSKPEVFPHDYKYFPKFWKNHAYQKLLLGNLEELKMPDYEAAWPPKDQKDLELVVFNYCSEIFEKPIQKFYKIMGKILRSIGEDFEKISEIVWTGVIEIIAMEKIQELDYSLVETEFETEEHKEMFVIYDKEKSKQYNSEFWFYVNNPIVKKELSGKVIKENLATTPRKRRSDCWRYEDEVELKNTLKNLREKEEETETVFRKRKMALDNFKKMMDDLDESMSISKKINDKIQDSLDNLFK